MIDSQVPLLRFRRSVNEGVAELNFKLRTRTAYSIFHAPTLGASRLRESRYGRNNRIGT